MLHQAELITSQRLSRRNVSPEQITTIKQLENAISRLVKKYPETLIIEDIPERPRGNNHYGENYWLLFEELRRQKELQKESKEQLPIKEESFHLKVISDKYPEQWSRLTKENPKLIHAIYEFLEILNVRRSKIFISDKDLAARFDHSIWDHFNPLLKKAADVMLECGINPGEFFK